MNRPHEAGKSRHGGSEAVAPPITANFASASKPGAAMGGLPTIMSVMMHKGYAARIEFDADDHVFVGRLTGITDIVTFHGVTVEELETAFKEAVDHYLAVSEKTGIPPQKPYSDKLMLRVPLEVHAHAAMMAKARGKSLNQWAAEVLANAH